MRTPAVALLAVLASLPAPELAAQQPPPLGAAQAWADADRDNRLNAEEASRLADALRGLVEGAHDVRGPLDDLADSDGNGRIDSAETARARRLWVLEPLAAITETAPGPARLVDLDSSGTIDADEIERAVDFLWRDPGLRDPRPVGGALDQRLDANGDGRVEGKEVAEALARLAVALTAGQRSRTPAAPLTPAAAPQAPRSPQPATRPAPPRAEAPRRP